MRMSSKAFEIETEKEKDNRVFGVYLPVSVFVFVLVFLKVIEAVLLILGSCRF